jgi:hypothetical protein
MPKISRHPLVLREPIGGIEDVIESGLIVFITNMHPDYRTPKFHLVIPVHGQDGQIWERRYGIRFFFFAADQISLEKQLVAIPLIVTDDSGIVTGRSGDSDRRHRPVKHGALRIVGSLVFWSWFSPFFKWLGSLDAS